MEGESGRKLEDLKKSLATEKNREEPSSKKFNLYELEDLWEKPAVKILVIGAAIVGLVYASKYLMNGAAESIRAYKNLRKAMKEG